ncbi:MAG: host-nuclease inhibitor Gam family protein [Pseudoxanthomonas sp.]|uniref:host-nuclease inhibitor Gam family protein n=1 Tax=Pseudoxanthomonas sp. TaxID=1871049 RepID=UPI002587C016|nr:host-nuclease inhibitor Gam family protein [Pseudoxanthomonas sp.]MCH2092688.1 host-nuclease inhibitor Gam family protein [Pseudoxanthomonas sp.]
MSKKSTRSKVAAVEHWVPQSRDEVNEAIAELGRQQRERLRIETAMNDEIAQVKAKHDADAKPLGERISELTKGLHLWCEANRATLTQDNKVKFHDFATGQVKWRLTPWSVSLQKVEDVIALLKAKSLTQFIRKKEEVDKDALLASRAEIGDSIKGVTFKQKEEFAVIPHESKIEEVQL